MAAAPGRAGRPPTRRTPHSRHTLLAEAVRLFNEKGFAGASMGVLAARLGITKSTLYHHVSGKEELLEMALDRAGRHLLSALRPSEDAHPAFVRLERFVRSVPDRPARELPFVQLLLGPDGRSVTGARADLERRVAELIRDCAREGSVRQDLPPDLCAGLLLDTLGAAVARHTGRGAVPTRVVAALALGGLRAPAPAAV
ncbi:TetR/AcrR family transcriptional regulator [Streptomyces sp. NPDC101118]|uniref:TetR/AcrR family transcriptional regulator n=1 Tax=Streptomyces sp. NPDC101118 TaxID=3366109 RepID=UPI00380B6D8D